jgi:hypothetical protein
LQDVRKNVKGKPADKNVRFSNVVKKVVLKDPVPGSFVEKDEKSCHLLSYKTLKLSSPFFV